jgi:hypothetical protein
MLRLAVWRLNSRNHRKIEGARDLFYFGATQKDTLPPIQKASTRAKARSRRRRGAQSAGTQSAACR